MIKISNAWSGIKLVSFHGQIIIVPEWTRYVVINRSGRVFAWDDDAPEFDHDLEIWAGSGRFEVIGESQGDHIFNELYLQLTEV